MQTLLKGTLLILALQICLAVFTGLSVAEIPLLPGGDKDPGIWLNGWIGAFIYPGFTAFVLICGFIDTLFSRKHKPSYFDRFYPPFIYVLVVYSFVLQASATLGGMKLITPHIDQFILTSGAMIILLGNIFPRVPYKSLNGLPLPWVFRSEKVWRKTHRFTGFSWVGAGALCIIYVVLDTSIQTQGMARQVLIIVRWIVVALVIFPFPYSYFIYRKTRVNRGTPDSDVP